MHVTLILIITVLAVVLLVVNYNRKEKQGSWLQFFAKGKDAGFSLKEIELLRRLAVKCRLEEPQSLFWSQQQLDVCIRSLVRNMSMTGEGKEPAAQDFLSRLYDYRKKIEMDKPKNKVGISNSRQMSEGQPLRVLVKGTGVFKSQVVKNAGQYLTISRPVNPKITGAFSWSALAISVYFWRDDDAGYVFDSEVQDEVFSKGVSALKISHSDKLFRTQKRKSVRLKMHRAAFLYPLRNEDDAGRIEDRPGLKCFIEDLSDSGCALTVGGQTQAGLRIKLQFALNSAVICMAGTVRSVDFREDQNRSTLHVEADPLPIETRNRILGEVFGTLPEEEEDLPFRILEEGGVEDEEELELVLDDTEENTS